MVQVLAVVSQTHDLKCLTMSGVAPDWREPVRPLQIDMLPDNQCVIESNFALLSLRLSMVNSIIYAAKTLCDTLVHYAAIYCPHY